MQLQKKSLSIIPFLLLIIVIIIGLSFIFIYSAIDQWKTDSNVFSREVNSVLNERSNMLEALLKQVRELDGEMDEISISFNGDMFLIFERIGEKPLEKVEEVVKLEQYYKQLLNEVDKYDEIRNNERYVNIRLELESLDYSFIDDYNRKAMEFNENISIFPYNIVAWSTRTKAKLSIPIIK